MKIEPDSNYLDDGRSRYLDSISASVPHGMRQDVRRAARMAGTSAAAFIRDAVADRVRHVFQEAGSDA